MKKQITNALGAIALVAIFMPAVRAADFQVIASKDVKADEISVSDLSRIFLLSKTSLPGTGHITPVLQKGSAVHEAFLKECLGKSDADLQEVYKELVFTGKANAPKVLESDAAVIAFVSMSKGAIAYVSASAIPMGVKKLTLK